MSPYSWLALTQAETFAQRNGVEWELVPTILGVLLDYHGLDGPVENEVKRNYSLNDVARAAAMLGKEVVGPPAHPFLPLPSLRTVCLFEGEPELLRLVVALADATWARGEDLTDISVIEAVVAATGFDASRVREGIRTPEVKARLREHCDAAIAAGVFGVPTFDLDGELFWGHDRLDALAARLAGKLPDLSSRVAEMLARPRGIDRKRRRSP